MYKDIIVNTFDTVFKNGQTLLQKLLIPIIIISIINFFLPQIIAENLNIFKENFSLEKMIIPLSILFLIIMANISIAVTTHRVAILGESSLPKFGSFIFGIREIKFLFKTIILAFAITIPVVLIFFIPIVGPFIGVFMGILLTSRLSFIYPSIACDEKMSLYESWKYTKGYSFLTLFTIIIFPLIFAISVGFVYTLAIEFLIKLVSPHFTILYTFLNVFITVFCISALSSAYLYIKPQPLNKSLKEKDNEIREIIENSKADQYKIIIHDKYPVTFKSLKKELENQYTKLKFDILAYDRKNAWLLKSEDDEEAYVSLRHENDEFTIHVKKTEKPNLNILKK